MDILKRFDVLITYKLDLEIEDRDGNTLKQNRNGKMAMTSFSKTRHHCY